MNSVSKIVKAISGFLLLTVAGCTSERQNAAIQQAETMIRKNQAECVLIKNGKILYAERGRGVSPLLLMYDTHRAEMKGAVLVDKVIGRAAAAIAISGGVVHVHGCIMSEDAVIFLRNNGITSSQTLLVPRILNRKRNGLCPLEKSVEGITDPAKAVAALRVKIASMKAAARQK